MTYTLEQWLEHLAKKQPDDFRVTDKYDYADCGISFAENQTAFCVNEDGKWSGILSMDDPAGSLTSDYCNDMAARIGKGYVIDVRTTKLCDGNYHIVGVWSNEKDESGVSKRFEVYINDVPDYKRESAIDTLIEIIRHEYGEPTYISAAIGYCTKKDLTFMYPDHPDVTVVSKQTNCDVWLPINEYDNEEVQCGS